ncbi:STAS domain-containing protein [Streptomyces sp. NPDC127079]|uniref:STAS domain-containing protein n=1 Tax=Streptomyces sp. NPDC127079 TaxID=3347132 RepID=UPI003667ED5A
MTTPLTLTSGRRPDGTPSLTVGGEIDMSNAGTLSDALAGRPGPLVLDLTAVEYLDSAGLSVLFAHADRLELVVTSLLEPVVVFSGLADLVTVHGLSHDDDERRRN